jgi:hypothetical protein
VLFWLPPYQRASALSDGAETGLVGRFPDPSGIDGCCLIAGAFLRLGTGGILLLAISLPFSPCRYLV